MIDIVYRIRCPINGRIPDNDWPTNLNMFSIDNRDRPQFGCSKLTHIHNTAVANPSEYPGLQSECIPCCTLKHGDESCRLPSRIHRTRNPSSIHPPRTPQSPNMFMPRPNRMYAGVERPVRSVDATDRLTTSYHGQTLINLSFDGVKASFKTPTSRE